MKIFQLLFAVIFILTVGVLLTPSTAYGLTYDLIAPSGVLTRGQDVQFIVNIDSEGTAVKNAVVGMTYQSQYLQYVSATPGDAMTTVAASKTQDGTLMISGTNPDGFNGSGVFAYVTFKIIAQSPGTAELCTLFAPSTTPAPSTAPLPTQLPVTGTTTNTTPLTILGSVLLVSSLVSFAFLRRSQTAYPHNKKH